MANFEILSLDPTTPQIRAPGAGDGYSVPRDMTFATGTTLNAPTTVVSVNTSTDALRITQVGSGNALLVEDSANPDASPTAITATGAVGIGTATPSTVLHVKGTVGGTDPTVVTGERVRIQSNDTTGRSAYMSLIAGTAANSGVLFGDQDAADVGQIRYLHSDNSMQFYTSSAERMRLTSAGDLGIGTNSPAGKLTVIGSNASAGVGNINISNAAYPTSGWAFRIPDAGTTIDLSLDGAISGVWQSVMYFLRSNGNVGIGTTSPATKLHVVNSAGNCAARVDCASGGTSTAEISFGAAGFSAVAGLRFDDANARLDLYTIGTRPIRFLTDSAERMRLDTSGNVGIGTSSPGMRLDVAGGTGRIIPSGGSANSPESGAGTWNVYGANSGPTDRTGALRIECYSDQNTDVGTGIAFSNRYINSNVASWTMAKIGAYKRVNTSGGAGGYLTFSTTTDGGSLTERARITATGVFCVGKTSDTLSTAGGYITNLGEAVFTANGNPVLYVNRLTDDGELVRFYQDTIQEGNISVSGSTVSYNGGHLSRWSQTTDNTRISLLKGTVMSNLDQMAVWIDPETGEPQNNEQLNCMKVSDVEGDVNVAGVFVNWDNDDNVFANDMNVAMTGDMIIRIAQGVVVQRGDLLMSAGDGTAKPQGDDIRRSKTVAKVTSTHVTCTYDDGSYCVPCVLMAC